MKNFTAGAWIQDLIAGIKHLKELKKMAIVNQKAVEKFTDAFSDVSPGEAKGFELNEIDKAKQIMVPSAAPQPQLSHVLATFCRKKSG